MPCAPVSDKVPVTPGSRWPLTAWAGSGCHVTSSWALVLMGCTALARSCLHPVGLGLAKGQRENSGSLILLSTLFS